MSNLLEPGNGGLPTASPQDSKAVPPPTPAPAGSGSSGPGAMHSHFTSKEDTVALQFSKIKEASGKLQAMRTELDKLAALQDTVTQDDVVEAASGLVAAGLPAAEVAGELASMPENSHQIQAWVAQQSKALEPREQQVAQALNQTGHALGMMAMKSVIAHSAEQHAQRRALAAAKPLGRV